MWTLLLTIFLMGSVAPESPGSDQRGSSVFIRVRGQQELRLTCGGGEGSVKSWLTPFGEVRSPGQPGDPVYMHPDGTLTLSRPGDLHTGRYRCLLQHRRGSTMFLYDLQVDPRSHRSAEVRGRPRRRVRSVTQDDPVKGHLAAAVAASLLMTFVVGFSFGALGRIPFSRCFEAITRRFKSPRRARRSDSLDEDSDVSMATLPSMNDNQTFQMECDDGVKREETFVPPKPQRSFRSKPVDQEAAAEIEGCDFRSQEEGWWRSSSEEEGRCSGEELVGEGEEKVQRSIGEEELKEDGRRASGEEEKSQVKEGEDWRTRGMEFSIDMWSDVVQEEREMTVGDEEEIWGGERSGAEEMWRRVEEDRCNKMELEGRRSWEEEVSVNVRRHEEVMILEEEVEGHKEVMDGEVEEEEEEEVSVNVRRHEEVMNLEEEVEDRKEVMDDEVEEEEEEEVRDQEREVKVQVEVKDQEEDHQEEVSDEEKEVMDQEEEEDHQEEVSDEEEQEKIQEVEGEEEQRKKSDEDNISELSFSSEEATGGEKQEESTQSPPPSSPRGRRSRVIRLYQYDEEGQLFTHLPTSDPAPPGPTLSLNQRSASLTRLSAIMAASAGPMDTPRTGSGMAAEERPFFHMEI